MHNNLLANGSTAARPVLPLFLLFAALLFPANAVTAFPEAPERAQGSIDILAVMVEFEPEENRFTSGEGTFDLDYLKRHEVTIDPLPHDRSYFEAHLDFAQNYFERVSNGLLDVEYEVLPEVVQVDGVMADYAPTGEDNTMNYKLANLAEDAWQKVADTGQADLSQYDPETTMFIVFHAGAGRDLELLGTTLDKTPQDIPSVYMGHDALSRLLDEPEFDGFRIDDSGNRVTNTAILPQTQSRTGEDVEGNEFLLELSINGILTANIGSFIGLPDLFNTNTGEAGIGRFGLMEGASIFSYLGLFPPEPSAWEKKYLGWADAERIDLRDEREWELPAVTSRDEAPFKRYDISSEEYYLLENRHRDPDGDGVTVTIRTPEGEEIDYTFDNTDEEFDPFDSGDYGEIMEPGVVVNVSNFDWSLPGGLDAAQDEDVEEPDEDRELNGGILIWQIDEAVIRNRIDDNEVNADPERKGVRLIEADGAQDIGRPLGRDDGSRFLQGHAFDFWWEGNDFTVITQDRDSIVVYENRFAPDTQPSTQSASGSRLDIEFYDFSGNVPEASFRLREAESDLFTRRRLETDPGDLETITPDARAHIWPLSLEVMTTASDTLIILPGANGMRSVNFRDPEQTDDFNLQRSNQPLLTESGVIAATYGEEGTNAIGSWEYENGGWEQRFSVVDDFAIPGLISRETGDDRIFIDHTDAVYNEDQLESIDREEQRSVILENEQVSVDRDYLYLPDGNRISLNSALRQSSRLYAGGLQENPAGFYVLGDEFLGRVDAEEQRILPWVEHVAMNHPALVDWDDSGTIDAVFVDRENNRLTARNQNGAVPDHFPVSAPDGYRFVGTPLIADIDGDGNREVLITIQDQYGMEIIAYNHRMRRLREQFPLFVGSVVSQERQPVHPVIAGGRLFAVSHNADLVSWDLGESGEVVWGHPYGEFEGNKVYSAPAAESGDTEPISGLLHKDETYNWPNPAGSYTHIRYETSEAATVAIKVATMSGSVIYDREVESRGQMPEEIEIDTSSWGSGVYYGRIEARNGNTSETEMIKIVVQH